MPQSVAAYMGMRYVVEGAQLGNRIIHKHLRVAFGSRIEEFGSFWMPDSAFQCNWRDVLNGIARLQSRDSLAAAARAARMTFRHMELSLVSEAGICD